MKLRGNFEREGDPVMHPNAQVILHGFQAFAAGDMAALKGLFTEDATWHLAGRNKWSGDYSGPDAIVEYMGAISGEATIDNQPHAVLADEDHVVVLAASSMTRANKSYVGNTVFVFHVSDGKVTEAWATPTDQYGQDDFWAG